MRLRHSLALVAISLGFFTNAQATDISLSGFGTIGYAVSDQSFNSHRFINKEGTLKADSLLGLQADVRFNEHWGATWQGVVAPAFDDNNRTEMRTRWGFLSYRPNNDWLVRLGKLRMGSFLNMQNMDVGTTYDMARLPAEVYSVSPIYDFTGLSLSKTWYQGDYEINLEGMLGKTVSDWRQYLNGSQQSFYLPVDLDIKGLMLTLNHHEDMYRLGWYQVIPTIDSGLVSNVKIIPNDPRIPNNPLAGLGGDLLVPEYVRTTDASVITIGASTVFAQDYRLTGEYARRLVDQIDAGPDSHAFYLNLSKSIGKWTPYIGYAKMWSDDSEKRLWRQVNSARLPSTMGYMPQVDQAIAANYQDAASAIFMYDQASVMLGSSYSFSATQKLKMEVMHTHIGEGSSLVDGVVSNKDILVYSLSYSFAF